MTVWGLIDQLKAIVEVHPEAGESQVWSYSEQSGFKFQIKSVGFDKKHRPARIKLED